MVVFRFAYVDASKQSIGSLGLACTITKAGSLDDSSQQCTGTAILPGGTLAITTAGKGGPTNRGAVLGGTGKYGGASGSFTSQRTSPTAGKDVFRVFLPRT
ncbi:MAG: hypothetical protein LC777_02305 [Actinobacteria bacterium]|nr:hypothetical protein [Actinomycetota bacterium]